MLFKHVQYFHFRQLSSLPLGPATHIWRNRTLAEIETDLDGRQADPCDAEEGRNGVNEVGGKGEKKMQS